jgi:hypothetical protein
MDFLDFKPPPTFDDAENFMSNEHEKLILDFYTTPLDVLTKSLAEYFKANKQMPLIRVERYDNDAKFIKGNTYKPKGDVLQPTSPYWQRFYNAKLWVDKFIMVFGPIDGENEYIMSGKMARDLQKVMKKSRTFLQTIAGDLKIYSMTDLCNNVRNVVVKKQIEEFFTKKEITFLDDFIDENYTEFSLIRRITLGTPSKNKRQIASVMKESVANNCVWEILNTKYQSMGIIKNLPDCRSEWHVNGMTYDDIISYGIELFENNKKFINIRQTVNIKDRDGRLIMENPLVTGKKHTTKENIYTAINSQLTLYQYNNHASEEPMNYKLMRKAMRDNDVKIQYVDKATLIRTFNEYHGYQHIAYCTNNTKELDQIYSWSSPDYYYILNDDRIDREEYPEAMNYAHSVYQDFKINVTAIHKDHALKTIFQNNDVVLGYETKGKNRLFAKGFKMARANPLGVFVKNKEDLKYKNIHKFDLNRAFTTYHKCEYHYDCIPDVPMEDIYACNNTILDVEGIEGHLFVKNIRPHFSIGEHDINFNSDDEETHDDTVDFLNLQDGIMMFPEARYWAEHGEIEIYAIIPSHQQPDILPEYLNKFTEDEKELRNNLLGRFISHQQKTVHVSSDKDEAEYLFARYNEEGLYPSITQIGSKYIIEFSNDEYSHGAYTHIHNYIISCTRVRMFQKMQELVALKGTIMSCRIDSILVNMPEGWKSTDDLLYGSTGKIEWKYEKPQCSLISPPKVRDGYVISDAYIKKKYTRILTNKLISLEAPGGYGKTHYIKSLFDNALFLAPTNCAALLIDGITIDKYLLQLKSFTAKPYRTVVIDEASMVDITQFNKLEDLLQKFYRNNQPFGGVQLVISGDPAQLLPVVGMINTPKNIYTDKSILKHFYRGKKFNTDYRRIGDDSTFSKYLNKLRDAIIENCTSDLIKYMAKIISICNKVERCPVLKDAKYIVYTNETVNKINDAILARHPGSNDIIVKETKKGFYNGQCLTHDGNGNIINSKGKTYNKKEIKHQPNYALTSHSVQGQTMADSNIYIYGTEIRRSPRAFYVAVSRATKAENVYFF